MLNPEKMAADKLFEQLAVPQKVTKEEADAVVERLKLEVSLHNNNVGPEVAAFNSAIKLIERLFKNQR